MGDRMRRNATRRDFPFPIVSYLLSVVSVFLPMSRGLCIDCLLNRGGKIMKKVSGSSIEKEAWSSSNRPRPVAPRLGSKCLRPIAYGLLPALLLVFLSPFNAFATDKLIVKDSSGTNTVFKVDDGGGVFANGNIGIGTTTPDQKLSVAGGVDVINSGVSVGAFGSGDVRNASFSRNAYQDGAGWERFDTSSYVVLDQQFGNATRGMFQIYTAAPAVNPKSNWVKQFEVNTDGHTFINGKVGIATASPTQYLDVNDNGIRVEQSMTPASSSSTCNQGQIAWDANYVYVCVAANTWKRSALASW